MRALILGLTLLALANLGCRSTREARAQAPRKVVVACTVQPQSTLVQVAAARGYFAEEGLDAQLEMLSYGKVALQLLLDHKADFATVAETPILFSVLKGEPFYVIANIEASSRNNAVVARRDAGIAKARDLAGKRVGYTPGTTSEFFLDTLLVSQGLSRGALRRVPLQPDEMLGAIQARTVDAACTWNYALTRMKTALGANGLVIWDQEIYTETFNLVASPRMVQNEPETVKRLLRALIKAEGFVAANPDAAQGIMAAATGTDPGLVREVWDAFNYVVWLDETLRITLEDETRWAMKNGLTDRKEMPDYRKVITADFLRAVRPSAPIR